MEEVAEAEAVEAVEVEVVEVILEPVAVLVEGEAVVEEEVDLLLPCASPLVCYLVLCTQPSALMQVLCLCPWMAAVSQTHRPI